MQRIHTKEALKVLDVMTSLDVDIVALFKHMVLEDNQMRKPLIKWTNPYALMLMTPTCYLVVSKVTET
jgi:hypothetical protein